MNEDEELPDTTEAVLSDEEFAALIRDLRACTEINEIIVKTGPGIADDQSQPSLDEAAQLLLERQVRGIQVRYRYDDAWWMDTLMPDPEEPESGIRLVRIRHDFEPGTD